MVHVYILTLLIFLNIMQLRYQLSNESTKIKEITHHFSNENTEEPRYKASPNEENPPITTWTFSPQMLFLNSTYSQ